MLDEAPWPPRTPRYYNAARDPSCTMTGPFFRGDFISAAADTGRAGSPRAFKLRRRFTLARPPVEAWLQGLGDEVASFTLNGRRIFQVRYVHAFCVNRAGCANVTAHLRAGANCLEIDYELRGGLKTSRAHPPTGGALAELFLREADGTCRRLDTDSAWESSVDGKTWQGVTVGAKPPLPPRASRVAYCDFARVQQYLGGGAATSAVPAGATVDLRADFRGEAPAGDFTVRVQMQRGASSVAWRAEIPAGARHVQRRPDGVWQLALPIAVPLYLSSGTYEIVAESNAIYCPGGWRPGFLTVQAAPSIPGFPAPPQAMVRPLAGWPEVHIDGRPAPLLWGGVQQDKRPDRQARHSDMPLTAVTVYNTYTEWHPRLGVYDFASFDRQAESYRRANPSAYFIWDLSVYPPPDFATVFPDDMACDATGDRGSYGRFSWSWASPRAAAEIREMVARAVAYLEQAPYANRILGYRINSGVTLEWLGWDARPGQVKDFSSVNQAAFRAFCAERYPQLSNPHVPDLAERAAQDAPNDILWHRARHLNAIAYMEYNSEIIARNLLAACGTAKETLARFGRRKLVGTYYGYTFYLNANGRDARRGHFALATLLAENRGRVDFLMSPQSYGQRRLGETCGDMKPFATLAHAGIKPVIEDDSRTHNHLFPYWLDFHQTLDDEQTGNVIKRNGAIALCHGVTPYFYALCTGLDFDTPGCAEIGRRLRAAQETMVSEGVTRTAEVALVASEKSVTAAPSLYNQAPVATGRLRQIYESDGTVAVRPERLAPFNGEVFMSAHTTFARAGAPVDYLLAEDLKNRSGDYKVYVFLNCFTYDAELCAAAARLRAAGKTLVWLYAPGYANDHTLESMKRLTGMTFARMDGPTVPGVSICEDGRFMGLPDWRVAQAFYPVNPDRVLGTYADGRPGVTCTRLGQSLNYFCGPWQLDVPFIRALWRASGVFTYTDADDPIEANSAFVTLHARRPGKKTIRLPRRAATVTEVFSGRVFARAADSFSFTAPLHETYLFHFR